MLRPQLAAQRAPSCYFHAWNSASRYWQQGVVFCAPAPLDPLDQRGQIRVEEAGRLKGWREGHVRKWFGSLIQAQMMLVDWLLEVEWNTSRAYSLPQWVNHHFGHLWQRSMPTWSQMSSHFFSLSYCRNSRALSGGRFIEFWNREREFTVNWTAYNEPSSVTWCRERNVQEFAAVIRWSFVNQERQRTVTHSQTLSSTLGLFLEGWEQC